jgi:hypothetical protein
VGFLLRPHLQNRRHCSGRTFIRLDRRFVHVRAGSRFSLLTVAANAFSRQHGSAAGQRSTLAARVSLMLPYGVPRTGFAGFI